MSKALLSVKNLKTHFFTKAGVVKAVDGLTYTLNKGETLGLVGESGSGKSVSALSIMRLVPNPPGRVVEGEIVFSDLGNLLTKSEREMQQIRGSKISMSFQDPMTFLNPVMRVGDQIAESLVIHQGLTKSRAYEGAIEAMNLVAIHSPEKRAWEYPHQMSGGMRQRVLLAMALSCEPELLIADEPTTALDVITQNEILLLIKELSRKLDMTIILITHDLGVVAEMSDKIAIMYAGHLMEYGSTKDVFRSTKHPYTAALLEAIPRIDWGKKRLRVIEGSIPDMIHPPPGCRFNPRCSFASERCRQEPPDLVEVEANHYSSCHRVDELSE
jgi:oligopeptide/dipeptide ABC transporter ATP-binding protein